MAKINILIELIITGIITLLCGAGAIYHLIEGNFATVLWFGFPLCFAVPALRQHWAAFTNEDTCD